MFYSVIGSGSLAFLRAVFPSSDVEPGFEHLHRPVAVLARTLDTVGLFTAHVGISPVGAHG
jgi:hypothetical protein